METKPKEKYTGGLTVHHVLFYSYSVYFIAILGGFLLNFFYPLPLFDHPLVPAFGFTLLVLGTILIYWAQATSRKTKEHRQSPEKLSKDIFKKGPYTFTSSPTHLGLTLMSLGFACTMNSAMLTITALLAFLLTRYVFVKKEEKMLAEKYGEHYQEYRKKIKI